MTKNRIKEKQKILQSKLAGEVIYDAIQVHTKLTGQSEMSAQYVKALVNMLKKQYSDAVASGPTQGTTIQRDITEAIDAAKKGTY